MSNKRLLLKPRTEAMPKPERLLDFQPSIMFSYHIILYYHLPFYWEISEGMIALDAE